MIDGMRQALKYRRVLGVNGNYLGSVFFCRLHYKLAGTNQRFFVSKGNSFAGFKRGKGWL
jgi:hypothetical protein